MDCLYREDSSGVQKSERSTHFLTGKVRKCNPGWTQRSDILMMTIQRFLMPSATDQFGPQVSVVPSSDLRRGRNDVPCRDARHKQAHFGMIKVKGYQGR